jgi:hypothetical protein
MSAPTTLAGMYSAIVKTVAAAALIGGGTMVLHTAEFSSVNSVQITDHDRRLSAVEKLGDKLEETNNNVIILNERLKNLLEPKSR